MANRVVQVTKERVKPALDRILALPGEADAPPAGKGRKARTLSTADRFVVSEDWSRTCQRSVSCSRRTAASCRW